MRNQRDPSNLIADLAESIETLADCIVKIIKYPSDAFTLSDQARRAEAVMDRARTVAGLAEDNLQAAEGTE
jgi:hypothetical protein